MKGITKRDVFAPVAIALIQLAEQFIEDLVRGFGYEAIEQRVAEIMNLTEEQVNHRGGKTGQPTFHDSVNNALRSMIALGWVVNRDHGKGRYIPTAKLLELDPYSLGDLDKLCATSFQYKEMIPKGWRDNWRLLAIELTLAGYDLKEIAKTITDIFLTEHIEGGARTIQDIRAYHAIEEDNEDEDEEEMPRSA